VKQIVGPVARRVVFWDNVKPGYVIKKGESFGMMKFGSRLDMYFPREDVEVLVKKGDKVRSGETVVARFKK
jgi:phosphatidylserine decarboxylase